MIPPGISPSCRADPLASLYTDRESKFRGDRRTSSLGRMLQVNCREGVGVGGEGSARPGRDSQPGSATPACGYAASARQKPHIEHRRATPSRAALLCLEATTTCTTSDSMRYLPVPGRHLLQPTTAVVRSTMIGDCIPRECPTESDRPCQERP